MLNVKVLGPGCAKCYAVEQAAAAGLEVLAKDNPDLEATLVHIEDILEIEQYPILFTPALVVNEKVVCAGRIPKKDEVLGWYRAALDHAD
jgi:hypothetical protein